MVSRKYWRMSWEDYVIGFFATWVFILVSIPVIMFYDSLSLYLFLNFGKIPMESHLIFCYFVVNFEILNMNKLNLASTVILEH